MSLLFRVIFANECTSTHHKLALDALRHLRDEDAEAWRKAFLYYFDSYLDGSKAPDKKFKDFRNHVLHVQDNYWGGALGKADEWYKTAVREMQRGAWPKAIYAAGVLSHYFTDPFMPFHSGQSEEETQIHRAVEWSIAKSYDELQNILEEQGGYPDLGDIDGEGWLSELIKAGAELGNGHYQTIIDHYDLDAGVKDPPSGLDQTIKDAIAEQIGCAAVGFARVLEHLFDEADVEPPKVNITVAGYLSTLTIPVAWVTRKIADGNDRKIVRAMYQEFKEKGRIDKTMPADDREVRRLYAEEVLGVSVEELDAQPLAPIGSLHGQGAEARPVSRKPVVAITRLDSDESATEGPDQPRRELEPRFYLKLADEIVDAPSIGAKTAKRFHAVGINTVRDFLTSDPEDVAAKLKTRWIDAELVEDWQLQAGLVCRIPNLRGHDAQLLVGCDYTDPEQIAEADADDLQAAVTQFAATREGKRVLRSSAPPDAEEVLEWIESAGQARDIRQAA